MNGRGIIPTVEDLETVALPNGLIEPPRSVIDLLLAAADLALFALASWLYRPLLPCPGRRARLGRI